MASWQVATTPEGFEYYWHTETREVTWTNPNKPLNQQPRV